MNGPRALFTALLLSAPTAGGALAEAPDAQAAFAGVAEDYRARVRPLLKQYCLKCHSTEEQQGELDLERFSGLDELRSTPLVWQKVIEMLDNGEMPPKKSPQLAAAERDGLKAWARAFLDAEARANAGDPGAVALRRLSNVEYDNTVRDLTAVDLKPAREFPADGAAGEGFTNVGEALAMSPALVDKYMTAAKGIAAHAVLQPGGFRFSDKVTRRDWTDQLVGQIQQLYRRYTDPAGSSRVNLQGLVWDTNSGGRILLEPYLAATIEYRGGGGGDLAAFARDKGLSAPYMATLWALLNDQAPSPLLGAIRERWKAAGPADVAGLAAEIRGWQAALTRFQSVAHFKPWMVPVNPLAEEEAVRIKLAPKPGAGEIVLHLIAREAGDGPTGDLVEWRKPRLEAPGRSPLLLSDLSDGLRGLASKRKTFAAAARYLQAADEVRSQTSPVAIEAFAKGNNLDPSMLVAWLDYLGVANSGPLKVEGLFAERIERGGGYEFVKGWGSPGTPNVLANSSDGEAHVPGLLKAHGVAVHPSPTQNVAVGWKSPIAGLVKVEARVVHAHPACGNGVSWSLELRRGGERRKLAGGELNVGQVPKIDPVEGLKVEPGDLLSLLIGPRGGNHACDLTEVDLAVTEAAKPSRRWELDKEVSPDVLGGNPHADALGNPAVWHFYVETIGPEADVAFSGVPRGSLLDRWRDTATPEGRSRLADDLQQLLVQGPPPGADTPDARLYRQLVSPSGPLLGKLDFARVAAETRASQEAPEPGDGRFGLPPGRFGKHPSGGAIDPGSLITVGSSDVEVRLPAELAAGREFVVTAALDPTGGKEGSVQAQVLEGASPERSRLIPGVPVLVKAGSAARSRVESSLNEFRRVFPAALCYAQIVPVDEVVTLVLFHREDEHFSRLMLDDDQRKELERLWDELRYVSQDALKVKEAYGQFMEYVTQDGDVRLFEPLRKPIAERAEALSKRLAATEPRHLDALVKFAALAYRRPLNEAEASGLRRLYSELRAEKLGHDDAFRLTLARVLVSPSFLYHAEAPASGPAAQPVSGWELASRLSYFLWASTPDAELNRLAARGEVGKPEVLTATARRMLRDDRARALATEFACQWLDVRGFDTHDEKSEQVFPEFAGLRSAMYEESVRFFTDLFARDGSVLEVLDADHTFVNEALAKLYGLPNVQGPDWRRVDGVKAFGRGGVLGMASLLAKQSGASRTSPILRGNWLSEMLLGEKLPKPPKNVPQLPESELDTNGLTLRQITEKHREVESCAKCHDKIDPFGFALEGFDAIGRRRTSDLAGRPIDTKVALKDGTTFADIDGLRGYVLTQRREEFLRHFCRKLLGYALGRSVQLSDEPLLAEMRRELGRHDYRVSAALDTVLRSTQFRLRRGLDSPLETAAALP